MGLLLVLAPLVGLGLGGRLQSTQAPTPLPTLFLIGDSTIKNGTPDQQGWGDPFARMFDPVRIRVENRARGGRSSRTYRTEGLWDRVLAELKPGDFVMMQFGHNDGGSMTEGRARASVKGSGDETQDVIVAATGAHEAVHTYGWYIRQYVHEAKAMGATAIVLSPVPRNIWRDGKVARASNDYGKWAAEAARAEGAFFIDLNDIVARHYEEEGQEKVRALYFGPTDHTHTTPAGAELTARGAAEGLRARHDCPLRLFLTADAGAGSPALGK